MWTRKVTRETGRSVLHCIWSLGRGGAERQLSYLAPELTRLGWDVHLAFAFGGVNRSALDGSNVTLHDLAAHHRRDLRVVARLKKLIDSLRPAIVQTWLTQMDVLGGPISIVSGARWILSERSEGSAYPPSELHALRVFLGRRADLVIANSDGGAEYWRHFRSSGNIVIPNGVPMEMSDSLPDARTAARRSNALLFVGRLGPEKNPGGLISALATEGMESYSATLCGDGPLRSEIVENIQAEGLSNRVTLAGDVDDIWCRMKDAAALVAPSWFEGAPNVVLEAAASGLPLVVSDIPAHRRILRPGSAVFVDPSSAASVAKGIRDALSGDVARRIKSAREDVAGLDVGAMAARYDQVYRSLVAGDS
jgi:glycosyltransferase involved in cell wall biosynthesis